MAATVAVDEINGVPVRLPVDSEEHRLVLFVSKFNRKCHLLRF